jgi:hypothetical protein
MCKDNNTGPTDWRGFVGAKKKTSRDLPVMYLGIGGRIVPNPYLQKVASGLDRMDCYVTYRISGPKAKGRTRYLY